MEERKSFATFKDGHTEEIFYFEKLDPKVILFGTKSGIYIYRKTEGVPGVLGLTSLTEFFRMELENTFDNVSIRGELNIESITLDERVEYKYLLSVDNMAVGGTVLVAPDASEDEIKLAIFRKCIDISYSPADEEDDAETEEVEEETAEWMYWDGWISNHDYRIDDATCSNCGFKHPVVRGKDAPDQLYDYCPKCKRKMRKRIGTAYISHKEE